MVKPREEATMRLGSSALGLAGLLIGCGSSPPSDSPQAARPAASAPVLDGRIVFTQQVGEHRDLFSIRPDGSGIKRLTQSRGEVGNPTWSTDVELLVFEDQGITVMAGDGTDRHQVGPKGEQGQPAWSPDARSIVLERDLPSGENGVWIMRSDGSRLRRLTHNPYVAQGGVDTDPNFSPDGRTISFVRRRSPDEGLGALFTMDRRGRSLRRITPWNAYPGTKHDWKPDGSLIAFSFDADPYPGKSSNIMIVEPDGDGLRSLTHHKSGQVNAWVGSWSPDGRHLVYKSDRSGEFQLYVMDADGGNSHRIGSGLEDPALSDWASASKSSPPAVPEASGGDES
jgi:TolB protein